MPRDLPLGNGRLLVNFDAHHNLRDIYFPHVGQANHAHGCRSLLGVWVDGSLKWHEALGWELDLRYQEETLVTRVTATNRELGVIVTVNDAVDFHLNVLVRRVEVANTFAEPREVRIFLHHDFSIWGTSVGDTVFYHPERRALVAYKDNLYMLVNGSTGRAVGLDSWTTGHKDAEEQAGSWRDAEDGTLEEVPVSFGSVDCVGALHLGQVRPGRPAVAYCWMALGEDLDEVVELDRLIEERGAESLITRTANYWRAWVNKEPIEGSAFAELPERLADLYKRSLLIIRTQTDHGGGIVAAADSNISFPYHFHQEQTRPVVDPFHGHEHYSYVWPRDGALTAMALCRAGYGDLSRHLIEFGARVMSFDAERDWGYMLQRYYPSGAVASNVIPWIDEDGNPRLPIQEDETGLMLALAWEHYSRHRDWELITPLYRTFIKPVGNFLLEYRDPATGLPLPSQDLWEERDGVHAFTVATVWAGLHAAANFTQMFGEREIADDFRAGADDVRRATEEYLYSEEHGRFVRTVTVRAGKAVERDGTVDASLFALFHFGMFDATDPRIRRTMDAVVRTLSLSTASGGVARYEGDTYQRAIVDDPAVPGNPWYICTLWVALYNIRSAENLDQLEPARRIIEWVADRSLPSGVLAEQLDPYTGDPVSTAPLSWSHGTVVATVNEYVERYQELSA